MFKALVFFTLSFNVYPHLDYFSDSGIEGKPYSEQVKDFQLLEKRFPDLVSVIKYGESLQGRPLVAIRVQAPLKKRNHSKAIIITGSIHGNEYLNIADRLPIWFSENSKRENSVYKYLSTGGVVFFFPILNPDGYDSRSRYNYDGADLNRDFTVKGASKIGFKQLEMKNLRKFIEKEIVIPELRLDLTVDYHCCNGSLLYPWSYKKERMPADDLRRHRVIGESMKKNIDNRYRHGITGEVLGYYPVGTSKDFYYERFNTLAFTFEGSYRKEHKNFEKHTVWWSEVLSFLLTRKN